MNVVFQYFLKILPIIYFMMYLTTVGGFFQLKSISKNVSSISDTLYLERRKTFLLMECIISVCLVVIGLIPIKGFGCLCSEDLIYPLGFSLLLIVKAVDTFFIFFAIDTLYIHDESLRT